MATRDFENDGYNEDRYAKGTGGQTSYTVDNPEPPQPGPGATPPPATTVPPPKKTAEQIYAEMQAATGTPTAENRDQLLREFNANGITASPFMYGSTPSGNELVLNGQKTKFTAGGNFGDPGASWYQWGSNDQGGGGRGTSASILSSLPGSYVTGSYAGGYKPQPYQASSIFKGGPSGADNSAFMQFLLGRANGSILDSSIPNLQVGPDDPIIRRQTDAYGASQTRSGRKYLQQLAERSGPNANIGTEGRMVAEQGAQATAGFEGQLMSQELSARRAQLQQSLATGAQFMSQQQQMQLQEELRQLEAAQQQAQFEASQGQQESQFQRDLMQHAFEFGSNDVFRNSPNYGG